MVGKECKKSKHKDKKSVNKSFWGKYKMWFFISLIVATILYVIIYLVFRGNGIFYVGDDLAKNDWLSFLGAYLSFTGTIVVSLIAILQSHYYTENEKARRTEEHRKNIQPIFSVRIVAIDKQIDGTAEAFSLSNPELNPKHKNLKISIENANSVPITNVIVCDKYILPLLKGNEQQYVYLAFWDSPDAKAWKDKLIVLTSEHERDEKGIPKWLNINFDDIDGKAMCQSFTLKYFDETPYYSLEDTWEF